MFFVGTPDHVEGGVGADSFFMVRKSWTVVESRSGYRCRHCPGTPLAPLELVQAQVAGSGGTAAIVGANEADSRIRY